MKKLVFLFCLIFCIFLTGCGEKKTVSPVTKGLSCTVDITVGDKSYTADVLAPGGGVFSAQVTKPTTLKGLKFLFDGEQISVTYLGLKYAPDNLPIDSGFAVVLKDVLASLDNVSKQAVYKDGVYVIEGTAGGTDYSLTVTDAGLPIKLTAPSLDLTILFSNVKVGS